MRYLAFLFLLCGCTGTAPQAFETALRARPICATKNVQGLDPNFDNVSLDTWSDQTYCPTYPDCGPVHSCAFEPGGFSVDQTEYDGLWLSFDDTTAGSRWFMQLPIDRVAVKQGGFHPFTTWKGSGPFSTMVSIEVTEPGKPTCISWKGGIAYHETPVNWRFRFDLACATDPTIAYKATVFGSL